MGRAAGAERGVDHPGIALFETGLALGIHGDHQGGGTRIGQGRDNARNYLRDNPDTARKIESEIRSRHMEAQALLNAPPAPRAEVVKETSKEVAAPAHTPTKGVKAAKNAEA